jgi:hypothetical protein
MRENCARTCGFCVVGEDAGGGEKNKGDNRENKEKAVLVERKWHNLTFEKHLRIPMTQNFLYQRPTPDATSPHCARVHGQSQQLQHKCPSVR